ncbi:hypothetical protein AJ80_09564 [Polytolypa hystricis UAMH7299]|uniref:Uncharacterized protein n=1 Tax=Polytolypa hystricis (strain UAMH7299) TaxID=1447883 RepID=A0A2B7WNW5_POLH7|nr:hypothetical protein AJ80_09564 [Polytolypa hystricis UAMH7299]
MSHDVGHLYRLSVLDLAGQNLTVACLIQKDLWALQTACGRKLKIKSQLTAEPYLAVSVESLKEAGEEYISAIEAYLRKSSPKKGTAAAAAANANDAARLASIASIESCLRRLTESFCPSRGGRRLEIGRSNQLAKWPASSSVTKYLRKALQGRYHRAGSLKEYEHEFAELFNDDRAQFKHVLFGTADKLSLRVTVWIYTMRRRVDLSPSACCYPRAHPYSMPDPRYSFVQMRQMKWPMASTWSVVAQRAGRALHATSRECRPIPEYLRMGLYSLQAAATLSYCRPSPRAREILGTLQSRMDSTLDDDGRLARG